MARLPAREREPFTSFEEAWRRFEDGAALVTIEEQRERFVAGRAQLLSFQVSLGELPVAAEVETLADELYDIEGLDLYATDLLHITVALVGFQVIAKRRPDDVLREEIGGISERAAGAFKGTAAFAARIGPVNVFPDALVLEVNDGGALSAVREALAAAGVAGAAAPSNGRYLPHVTIGVFRSTAAAQPLRERLPPMRDRAPFEANVRRIDLVRYWFTGDDLSAPPEADIVRSYRLR
jgi:2'-5' RNA ligase